jgi:2-C-methyl-D-erythritol 2,4-cyclodiphosphate synthase
MLRVGYGYDVHQLADSRPLILGGVNIPYYKGLLGHSDGDALVHAICDALLGAAGLNDIGHFFPDTDPKWKGVAGAVLLKKTASAIDEIGYRVENIDSTIVAEKPKMLEYLPKMRKNISEALGIDAGRINIKATTSEGMGFIGEGAGIAAHAVCLISRKESH